MLTLDGKAVSSHQVRLDYDVELAATRLVEAGLPSYFAEYLRTGGNVVTPAE